MKCQTGAKPIRLLFGYFIRILFIHFTLVLLDLLKHVDETLVIDIKSHHLSHIFATDNKCIFYKCQFQNEAGKLPNIDLDRLGEGDYPLASNDGATLLASTLDGKLIAINQATGEILWKLDDEPVVRSPFDSAKPTLPAFLPDPKDGSIYMIGHHLKEPLKKLPFTIPQLVAASPCKSSDGILYTGKKVDTWFSVDRFTGIKSHEILNRVAIISLEITLLITF